MLPPVVNEGDFFPFKFWFNSSIQDGMYYRSELYYRLHTVDARLRARLYHYACKLSRQNAVVVTTSDNVYSLWLNLRSSSVTDISSDSRLLPLMDFFSEQPCPPHSQNGSTV